MGKFSDQLASLGVVEMPKEKWLKNREFVIGGSDNAQILTDPEGALKVYSKKLGLLVEDEPTEAQIEARELGLVKERPLAEYWARKHGFELVYPEEGSSFFSRHAEFPFIGGSPDCFLAKNGVIVHGGEVKTRNEFDAKNWNNSETLPMGPLAQITTYQLLVKLSFVLIAEVAVHELRDFMIERDEALEANIVEIDKGLHRCIESRTPPPLVYGQVAIDYLKARYPEHGAELLVADAQVDALLNEYKQAADDESDAEKRKKECQAKAQELITDQYYGIQGSRWIWTFKTTKSAEKVDKDRVITALANQVSALSGKDYSAIIDDAEQYSRVTVAGHRRSHWKENK